MENAKSIRLRYLSLFATMYAMLAAPHPALANMCFGHHFSVEVLIESCTDGPHRDPKYGLINLRVLGKALKLEKSELPETRDYKMTMLIKPDDIVKLNELRTYLIPTGNGYVGSPIAVLSCGNIVGRQMKFTSSTCMCESEKCAPLGVELPEELRQSKPNTEPSGLKRLFAP